MLDGADIFAGMDPRLAAEAEKMWKQLNDMSASDPEAYTSFIKEQMQSGAAEGYMPPTPDMPVPGRRVRVHSLVKMAEYNGREGVVKSSLDGGRLCVLLDPGREAAPSPSKELSLKAVNLEVIHSRKSAPAGRGGGGGGGGKGASSGKSEPLQDVKVKLAEEDTEGLKELAMPSNAAANRRGAGPLIQEVSETINDALPHAVHTIKLIAAENGAQQLVVTVECPHAAAVGEIDMQVSSTEISIDTEGQQPLIIPLQYTVCMCVYVCRGGERERKKERERDPLNLNPNPPLTLSGGRRVNDGKVQQEEACPLSYCKPKT